MKNYLFSHETYYSRHRLNFTFTLFYFILFYFILFCDFFSVPGCSTMFQIDCSINAQSCTIYINTNNNPALHYAIFY